MIKKTLYFGNPAYLSLSNKQLVVKLPEVEKNETIPDEMKARSKATIPIEDIGVVVLDNKQITITQGLLAALLDNTVAVINCNDQHMPVGMFMPLHGNTTYQERFRNQLESSVPLRKQMWQQTIMAKIENQAKVLDEVTGKVNTNMHKWAKDVKSGDADMHESRAAVYYWKNLFVNRPNFIRDQNGEPPNNLLNYGYSILRGVIARSLVVSGLLPVMGIHHHNKYNPYCLADDIMEPYRPFVDKLVISIMGSHEIGEELTTDLKRELLSIPVLDVKIGGKRSPLMIAAGQTTASLAKCFNGESRKLVYPEIV
ncbi:MAG: type II CRISPR-associated endonuclease Cas1 [Prevotella sp.]|jgi:CRISPR-associated protein Cas1|nr:type II CRISPR-associated endonuclease Cas1 [Prevotella sp.]